MIYIESKNVNKFIGLIVFFSKILFNFRLNHFLLGHAWLNYLNT